MQDIKNDSRNIVLEENNIISLGNQLKEIESFNNKYSGLNPNLEKIDQLFVDSKNPVSFIEFLEKISSDSQINSVIALQSSLQKEKVSGWQYLTFNISCDGDYLKTLKFLERLENSPYLIEVSNIAIKKSGDSVALAYSSNSVETFFLLKVFSK